MHPFGAGPRPGAKPRNIARRATKTSDGGETTTKRTANDDRRRDRSAADDRRRHALRATAVARPRATANDRRRCHPNGRSAPHRRDGATRPPCLRIGRGGRLRGATDVGTKTTKGHRPKTKEGVRRDRCGASTSSETRAMYCLYGQPPTAEIARPAAAPVEDDDISWRVLTVSTVPSSVLNVVSVTTLPRPNTTCAVLRTCVVFHSPAAACMRSRTRRSMARTHSSSGPSPASSSASRAAAAVAHNRRS